MSIIALALILLGGIAAYRTVSGLVYSGSKSTESGTDLRPIERQETKKKLASPEISQPKESTLHPNPNPSELAPKFIKPQPTIPIESVYLKSLEGVSLPVTLVVDETISLLDATGKELPIAPGRKILVKHRSPGGTLEMMIDSKPFVGNESRLSNHVRIDTK